MITKEDCRTLYNLYSQIETTESLISDLKKFIEECDGKVPEVLTDTYVKYGSIEICVPHFQEGKFTRGSATVYNIKYDAAIAVLTDHVADLRKKAKELSDKLEGKEPQP